MEYSRHWLHQDVVKDEGKGDGKGNVEWEKSKKTMIGNFGKAH